MHKNPNANCITSKHVQALPIDCIGNTKNIFWNIRKFLQIEFKNTKFFEKKNTIE